MAFGSDGYDLPYDSRTIFNARSLENSKGYVSIESCEKQEEIKWKTVFKIIIEIHRIHVHPLDL